MTAFWFILACIALIIVIGAVRNRIGIAIADTALLVGMFGLIALGAFVLNRFYYTNGAEWTVAGLVSLGFLFEAIYGLMAPARQRRRDQWIRSLRMRRRA